MARMSTFRCVRVRRNFVNPGLMSLTPSSFFDATTWDECEKGGLITWSIVYCLSFSITWPRSCIKMSWLIAWTWPIILEGQKAHLPFKCDFNPLTTDHTSMETDFGSDSSALNIYVLMWIPGGWWVPFSGHHLTVLCVYLHRWAKSAREKVQMLHFKKSKISKSFCGGLKCHNTSGLHLGKFSRFEKPVEFLWDGAGALVTEKGSGSGVEKKK